MIDIEIINSTIDFWFIQLKTQFHHIIAQYVTKMVKFSEGQRIRRNLYILLGDPYNQEIFNSSTKTELNNHGLLNEQIATLRIMSDLIDENDILENNLQRISQVKGVGPWTIKSVKLMLTDDIIFLYEDSYIRSRLAELYDVPPLNHIRAKNIGLTYGEYQSQLSKFLWRIKKSGIKKIKLQQQLMREDFL